ncbi:MAG: EF-hand domain-containing protein [Patescibacteria group bacterium]|nr:EF-hand domain-containing protein [Patescibacteria group bacterium]
MNFETPKQTIPSPESAENQSELAEVAIYKEQKMFQGVFEKLGKSKKLRNLAIALSFASLMASAQGCESKKPMTQTEQQQKDYDRWSPMKKNNFNYALQAIQGLGNQMKKEIKEKGGTNRTIARDIVGMRINQLALAQKQGIDIRSGGKGSVGIADRFMTSKDMKTYLTIATDKNKDGSLSQKEKEKFEKNPAIPILRQKMQVIDTFGSLDKDNDGKISQREEANYLQKIAKGLRPLSEEEAEEMKKEWNKAEPLKAEPFKKSSRKGNRKIFDEHGKPLPVQGVSSNPNDF